jgi:hypothetical protein
LPSELCVQERGATARLKTIDLIYQNLIDENARHLMIICGSPTVEEFLISQIREFEVSVKKKDPRKIVSLHQSKGREELVRVVMTRLPLFVRQGYTIIMKDLPEVYGCMYDLLNQNYAQSSDENDRGCDLQFETTKETVQVHPDFKCIILMEREDNLLSNEDIETKQQPPFLNRFEKYLIKEEEFIQKDMRKIFDDMRTLYLRSDVSKLYTKPVCLFHNLSKELLYSAVIENADSIKDKLTFTLQAKLSCKDLYLNYLKQVVLSEKSETSTRSMLNEESRNMRERVLDEDGKTRLKTLVIRKLISLASRNMIFQNLRLGITFEMPSTFKEDFLASHPYDNLTQFLKDFQESSQTPRRAIIFTYSSVWEVTEYMATLPAVRLFTASELHQKNSGKDSSALSEVAHSSRSSLLVVQFANRREWELCQNIRLSIEATCMKKHVLFVAHYELDDMRTSIFTDSAINFLTRDWQMVVIDDIKGCNYAATFDVLEKNCQALLTQPLALRNSAPDKVNLSQEIVEEGLKQFIVENSNNYSQLAKGNRLVKFIEGATSAIKLLASKFEKFKDNLTVLQLLEEDNLGEVFDNYLDGADYLNFRVKSHFLSQAKSRWSKFREAFPFDTLYLATELPDNLSSHIGLLLNRCLECGQEDRGFKLFKLLSAKRLNLQPLETLMVGWLRGLQAFKNQGKWSAGISGLKNQLAHIDRTSIFPEYEVDLIDGPAISQLQALVYLEKYLKGKMPDLNTALVVSTIQKVARKYEQLSKSDFIGDSRNFAMLMIMIAEIFKEEFNILNECMEYEPISRHEAIAKQLAEEFTANGKIDFTKYLSELALLKPIESASDLQMLKKKVAQVRRLRTHFEKEGNSQRFTFDIGSCRMVEACLTFIGHLHSGRRPEGSHQAL